MKGMDKLRKQIEKKAFFVCEFFNKAEEKTTNKKLQNELFGSEVVPLEHILALFDEFEETHEIMTKKDFEKLVENLQDGYS